MAEFIGEQTQNNFNTNNITLINLAPLPEIIHLNVFSLNLEFDQKADLAGNLLINIRVSLL